MRNWAFWDWIGFSCIWIAALALASDGAIKNSPDLSKLMPEFFTGKIWPFVPLLFVVIGTVVLLAREFGLLGNRRQTAPSPPPSTAPRIISGVILNPRDEIKTPEKQERIFVSSTITSKYLIGFFHDHTGIQAKKLTEAFIGKWMRVSGHLSEVLSSTPSFAQVTFKRDLDKEEMTDWSNYVTTYMYFREGWLDRVAILKRGDKLTVIGQIRDVSSVQLDLDNCELIDSD